MHQGAPPHRRNLILRLVLPYPTGGGRSPSRLRRTALAYFPLFLSSPALAGHRVQSDCLSADDRCSQNLFCWPVLSGCRPLRKRVPDHKGVPPTLKPRGCCAGCSRPSPRGVHSRRHPGGQAARTAWRRRPWQPRSREALGTPAGAQALSEGAPGPPAGRSRGPQRLLGHTALRGEGVNPAGERATEGSQPQGKTLWHPTSSALSPVKTPRPHSPAQGARPHGPGAEQGLAVRPGAAHPANLEQPWPGGPARATGAAADGGSSEGRGCGCPSLRCKGGEAEERGERPLDKFGGLGVLAGQGARGEAVGCAEGKGGSWGEREGTCVGRRQGAGGESTTSGKRSHSRPWKHHCQLQNQTALRGPESPG